jgi:hypothetical protein
MPQPLSFERFYSHEELTKLLHSWAEAWPELMELTSIGPSWEGRDIWLVALTNHATGPALEKPGFLVEANIHAAEITASFAALHLIERVLTGHGSDERVTRLLDTRTLYVIPRLNPDGVEHVLNEGRYLRSSARPHPLDVPQPGLQLRDIDGDGRVLFMRVPDPDGPWKPHPDEPRLLVRRGPDEYGGEYYRIFQEGEVVGYDGATVQVAEPLEGLDLGQNLPTDWSAAPETPAGAGPFPGSEPETQAILRAVVDRPNITGYVTCHTFGGIHLRPPLNAEDPMPHADLLAYEEFGAKATELTGYTAMSFHDLKHRPWHFRGGQLGWYYDQLGLFSWITEFWNPLKAVGRRPYHPSKWLVDHPVDDDLALIRWSDEELDGKGFVDWYPFDHPQLGRIELGGWDMINYWYNPPFERIEEEVAPHSEWVIYLALTSPRLEVRSLNTEQVSPGVHRVQLVVGNTGWLPTYVSERALDRKIGGSVTVALDLPEDATLLSGAATQDLGQLDGRISARTTTTWWGHNEGTPDLAAVEWLVAAPSGTSISVTARHPRAGTSRARVELG